MLSWITAFLIIFSIFLCLEVSHGKAQISTNLDKRIIFDCAKNNPDYKETDYLRNVWFLRKSTQNCDTLCTSSLGESIGDTTMIVYSNKGNVTNITHLKRIPNSSQYNFKAQSGSKPGIYNVAKVASDYYIGYRNDNKETVEVWTMSPFTPIPKITSGCGSGLLKDCKAEKNCKRDGGQGPNAKICLIPFPGYNVEMFTALTWHLKYSTEPCKSRCVYKIGQSVYDKLKIYTFNGRCSKPTVMDFTRIGDTSTYSYQSQHGGTKDGLYNIVSIDKGYYKEYTTDHGQESIQIYVANPFGKVPKVSGCGGSVTWYDCKPEINCIKSEEEVIVKN